tara:strand:+ start:497 stop:766 length:270 start_codon:yes stop_codon:yes gene_type:complete
MLMSDKDYQKNHAKKSRTYNAQLKKAIHDGDLEGIIKSVMLLSLKANELEDWKASPRTFMELCQVLVKYRQEFGGEDMSEIFRVIEGGE